MEKVDTKPTCKVRSDSWAAGLTEAQQWALYEQSRQTDQWAEPLRWAEKEFGLARMPSRAAFYRWQFRMRELEFKERLEDTEAAIAEAEKLAKASVDTETKIKAFMALAVTETFMHDNLKAAAKWIKIAAKLQDADLKAKKVEFARHEVEIQEAKLDLARRRFESERRRYEEEEARLHPPKLTAEELKRELDKMFGYTEDRKPQEV